MKTSRVYLDNAATTPLDKKVADTMRKFDLRYLGNPNSIHREGQEARAQIDFARENISHFFFCQPQEIIFTSGATESNNLAIQGVVSYHLGSQPSKPHVITTLLEHQSVYNVVKELERKEIIEATFIKPDKNGIVAAEEFIKEIKDNTVLISAIFVSNEIGSVLPIRELGKLLTEYNKRSGHKVYLHTDAAQAIKFYNCHVDKLGVDFLTFSGHKINGPKGIGGLYIKSGVNLSNLMFGGSQEYDKRPGTQNTTGIIGLAKAIELLGDFEQRQSRGVKIRKLKTLIANEFKHTKEIEINGNITDENSCPDIISLAINGADQEMVIAKLDLAGFAVSTGSACVSGSTEPSHVIKALGRVGKDDRATIRISLSTQNTTKQLKELAKVIKSL